MKLVFSDRTRLLCDVARETEAHYLEMKQLQHETIDLPPGGQATWIYS